MVSSLISDFLAGNWVATTLAPKGLGAQDPDKMMAHLVDHLGQLLSRNHVFKIFRLKHPPHK